MIIDYDHNPNLTYDQKLQSLKESVQMALNEFETNNATSVQNDDDPNLAKTIIEDYTGSTLAGSAQSVKSAIDALGASVDELDDKTTWKSVYGTKSVYLPSLPSDEVIVRIRDSNETLNFSFVLTKRMFELGGNYSSGGTTSGDYCSLEVNKNGDNKLYVLSCYISGTNYQSGAIITAYYR